MARTRSRGLVAQRKRQLRQSRGPSTPRGLPAAASAEKEDQSAAFTAYYEAQALFGGDGRGFAAWMRSLRQPLPMTFRLNEATADTRLLNRCKRKPEKRGAVAGGMGKRKREREERR